MLDRPLEPADWNSQRAGPSNWSAVSRATASTPGRVYTDKVRSCTPGCRAVPASGRGAPHTPVHGEHHDGLRRTPTHRGSAIPNSHPASRNARAVLCGARPGSNSARSPNVAITRSCSRRALTTGTSAPLRPSVRPVHQVGMQLTYDGAHISKSTDPVSHTKTAPGRPAARATPADPVSGSFGTQVKHPPAQHPGRPGISL